MPPTDRVFACAISLPFYLRLRVVPDAVQVLPNVMVLPDALALEAGQYTVPSS